MSIEQQGNHNRLQGTAGDGFYNSMDLISMKVNVLHLEEVQQIDEFSTVEGENVKKQVENSPKERNSLKQSVDQACNKQKIISLDEVAWHDTIDNCWIVIYDYVYDCTEFMKNHPGGQDVLLEYAGRDATVAFVGTGHSQVARQSLERYIIGELPPAERIFRIPGGVKVSEF